MNTNHAELQSEIKMGRFEQSSENQLDAMTARNRMFDEVQQGHVISPIYRSPENPGKNLEIGAMLGGFAIGYPGLSNISFSGLKF